MSDKLTDVELAKTYPDQTDTENAETIPEGQQHVNDRSSEKPVKSSDNTNTPSPNNAGQEVDPNVVWWDGEDDPENPYNWPGWRKYLNCGLISALTFVTPLASSIFAPAVPTLMVDFRESNQELASFVVSIYVLGFAIGPLVMAPLSELYGRLPVYHICNLCFLAFTVGCALAPNMGALVTFRFLAGTFGACPLTNGGGSISDMIHQDKRAIAMSAFSIGPLIGPILGPVVGGVVADKKGWRWVFWIVAIVSGALSAAMIVSMRETYAPVILQRKTKRLIKETGNTDLRSKLDSRLSKEDTFKRAIVRPMKLLIFSPICTVFALFMALVYGYLYLLFTSVTFVFKGAYGFGTSTVGLVYLGLGVGSFIGLAWFSVDTTRKIKVMKEREHETGDVKPEVRLGLLPVGSLLLPVGFFIYGWTADKHTHWMGPIIGLTVIGAGMVTNITAPDLSFGTDNHLSGNIICFMAVSMYLVDAYSLYSASALAANTVIRSIAGAVLPLCALKMYATLGLGWGNSLLAFIALALLPVPFLIQRYGEKLRMKFDNSSL
ncbi:uncharacterized protein E0L32_000894 [Thyridium curvatum]|uniref:Major facilitator superfamily (MFS) profile domain-containing protein n=1 Tax=Thyridium curvatum TaxID=1093900 RepID=A0A507AYX6_9PEZI|nr:uncharacterized protein E0L32_000894 [Thyridium curvatum]TPX12717.1 hypothetical protein E0L32_000894 [Thyridium curvatum]